MSLTFRWAMFRLTVLVCCAGTPTALPAEVHRVGPQEAWFELLTGDELQAGDEVWLASGVYSNPRKLTIRVSGEMGQPIVIRAAPNAKVRIQRPDARQNSINLEGVQYLELRDLEIQGGASAIRIGPQGKRQSSHIVLEALHIHHIGGVAVTCNHSGADYTGMVFRRNHIHHTAGHGEAFYLGGNHGSAIIHDSVIELNYIHHLDGEQVSQGDGIEIKTGSYGNRIAGNVIHNTRYPGITLYGTGGHAVNRVLNNWIWDTGDHGIQVAADALVSGNVIADAGHNGIYSREHQGALPGNLTIRDNWVLVRGAEAALRIHQSPGNGDAERTIAVLQNQLWSASGKAMRCQGREQLKLSQNVGIGEVLGIEALEQEFRQTRFALPKLDELPADHPAASEGAAAQFRERLRAAW